MDRVELEIITSFQARNQEFFRAGEVFQNKVDKLFICITRKKGPAGKNFGDFFPRYT